MGSKMGWLRALALATLLAPAVARAQDVTTVWISGVGDDAAPGIRTAPVATLAGALAVASAETAGDGGAAILMLDQGELQPATVTQAVTVDGRSVGSIVAGPLDDGGSSAAVGLEIAAPPDAVVVLRNLTLDGAGQGQIGIHFTSGRALVLDHVEVRGFTGDGIQIAGGGSVSLRDVVSHGNGGAGLALVSGGAPVTAVVNRTRLSGNAVGLDVGPGGRATLYDGVVTGNAGVGIQVEGADGFPAEVNVESANLSQNGLGVRAGSAGVARLSEALVVDATFATELAGTGQILSFGNNRMLGLAGSACAAGFPVLGLDDAGFVDSPIGDAYPAVPFLDDGALGSLSFSATGLPDGLDVDGGVLAGVPTELGQFAFTVTAVDGNGCPASLGGTVNVVCRLSGVSSSDFAGSVETGAPVSATFAGDGAYGTTVFTEDGGLPIGLGFDGSTGVLSGTPTEPGTFPLTITVVDASGCSATATSTLVVTAAAGYTATTATLDASPNPAEAEAPVTLTVTLDPTIGPTGEVDFYDGDALLGSAEVNAGAATLTRSFAVGTHALSAVYLGDATYGGARTAPVSLVVEQASTTTVLDIDPAEVTRPASTTFTAHVTGPGIPDGVVTFFDGDADAGSATLAPDGGEAVASITVALAVGSHSVTAAYHGSSEYLPSSSAPETAIVDAASTATSASSSSSGSSGASSTGSSSSGGTTSSSSGGSSSGASTSSSGGASSSSSSGSSSGSSASSSSGGSTGSPSQSDGGGCGCGTGGRDAGSLALLGLAAALLGRRRRIA